MNSSASCKSTGFTPAVTWLGVSLWLTLLLGAFVAIDRYDYTPGEVGSAAQPTIVQSALVSTLPRLVMFVHPHCPCTRASLQQLQQLLERYPGALIAEVVLVKPTEAPEDWAEAAQVRIAAALPTALIHSDDAGSLAKRFGALTSGHVMFYAADGRLLFSGGITATRGHVGPSVGLAAITALSTDQAAAVSSTPVYGCALFTPPRLSDPARVRAESDPQFQHD